MRRWAGTSVLFSVVWLASGIALSPGAAMAADERPAGDATKPASLRVEPAPDGARNFVFFYEDLERRGEAALITADAALWATHRLHDQALAGLEVYVLAPRLRSLVEELTEAVDASSATLPEALGPAAARLSAYLVVARSLSMPTEEASGILLGSVRAELKRIADHKGFAFSSVLDQKMDYSQMEPRGHYTRSEALQRYFRVSMWLGRTMFRLDELHPENAGLPPDHPPLQGGWFAGVDVAKAAAGDEAELRKLAERFPQHGVEEMQAAGLLAATMSRVNVDGKPALEVLDEIERPLEAFFGDSDDLSVRDLLAGFKALYGKEFEDGRLKPEAILADRMRLLRWVAWLSQRAKPAIDSTGLGRRGFCLLGQREVLDSSVFQRLVAGDEAPLTHRGEGEPFTLVRDDPRGPLRGFPRGLDLLSIAGNRAAETLLEAWGDTAYEGYDERVAKLRTLWADRFAMGGKEMTPVYDLMLDAAVQAARAPARREWPAYMQSPEHRLVRLNAGLAFWATLRHDSILHVKQSYTGVPKAAAYEPEPKKARGYVEPRPELYRGLAAIARRIESLIPKGEKTPEDFRRNAQRLGVILERLADIAERELDRPDLVNAADFEFIRGFGNELSKALWLSGGAEVETGYSFREPVAIVADVHTRVPLCLEEAVGDLWQVRCEAPLAGGPQPVTGAILSYYEFKQPMAERLTDEKWREMLRDGKAPKPLLLGGFMGEKK